MEHVVGKAGKSTSVGGQGGSPTCPYWAIIAAMVPPGTGTTVSVGCTAFLAGLTIAATSSGPWHVWGYVLALASVGGTAGVLRILSVMNDARRRRLHRARTIANALIAEGKRLLYHEDYSGDCDRFSNASGIGYAINEEKPEEVDLAITALRPDRQDFIKKVEDWRTMVGYKLRGSPFKAGTDLYVLDPTGNRLDLPLNRLREMLADLDKWVDHGD